MSERLHEIISGLMSRLKSERPAAAYRITTEASRRRTAGEALGDILQWQLEEAASELGTADSSAFGIVAEEGDPAPNAGPVGGRPKLMSEDDRRAFLRFMAASSGPVKVRVAAYQKAAPWCRLSEAQLADQWRNRANVC
ncbi:MAG: hypothetical protein ACRYGP_21695 [Janthinobacterium lividum]